MGFPSGSEIKNLPANTGNAGDRFNPWVGKIPLRRKWQPIPLFLPGKSPWTEDPGGVQSMGLQLSDWAHTRTHCINMTFIYLNWETKKFMWLNLLQYSLYCSSLQTHNISKECLYWQTDSKTDSRPESWNSQHTIYRTVSGHLKTLPEFKTSYKAMLIKTMWYWWKKKKTSRSVDRTENPGIEYINGAGTTGHSHAKKSEMRKFSWKVTMKATCDRNKKCLSVNFSH